MEGVICGNQAFEILSPPFHIWENLKVIFKEVVYLAYERHTEVELYLENIKYHNIQTVGKDRNLVVIYY